MQLLYKKGNLTTNDLLQQDEYGSTPLHFAAIRNSTEAVHFILAHGGNPLLTNNNQKKPSEVTSDEQIRQKLIAKENTIIEKKLQDKGRPPRRSQDNIVPVLQSKKVPVLQSKKPNGKPVPSTTKPVAPSLLMKSKTSAANSKSNIPGTNLAVGESNSSSKQSKLKVFVSANSR